jgi:hypothetical protein
MSAQLEEDAPRVGTPASQAAVEECYHAEHARLWRSLLLFSGDADLASDAVSEAFTQALHRGDRDPGPPPMGVAGGVRDRARGARHPRASRARVR